MLVAAWVLLAVVGGDSLADPILQRPAAGRGALGDHADGSTRIALIGDVDILAILGAERATTYPEVGVITGNEPELAAARIGLVGLEGVLSYVLRVDVSEASRLGLATLEDRPVATCDAFLDDAALWWTPRVWANLVTGRVVVPFSRFRQLERVALTTGGPPFLVDRVAPDRRWGATFHGDLGSLSYAAGAYADFDQLELRAHERPSSVERAPSDTADPEPPTSIDLLDPSTGGRTATAFYLGWTPRAPLGPDHMATPGSDPWFDTVRPGAGLGILWRDRAGRDRLDISLSSQFAFRSVAAIAEILAHIENDTVGLAVAGQASLLMGSRAVVFALAEYDDELALYTAGGGAGFFATRDRRNKISLVGWMRRESGNASTRDGVVVHLQASL